MRIKNHYKIAFEEIKRQYNKESCNHKTDFGYRVPSDISLEGAIEYTESNILNSLYDTPHYRYDRRYWNALHKVLKEELRFNPTNRQVVNLDLGCGPGLFSWVVRDYILDQYDKNDDDICLIGYDYAGNMIRLANLFREHFPMKINFTGYSEMGKIQKALSREDFSDCDVIVTFGHVLIQVSDDGINKFTEIIQNLFQSNSCILIAVDARRAGGGGDKLRPSCEKLQSALSRCGANIEHVLDDYNNSMWACRLSMGERDGGR